MADQEDTGNFWNGNDAIVLRHIPTDDVVDSFGQLGVDPGSVGWTGGSVGTTNRSLCRKTEVMSGDTMPADAFDPSMEWIGFAQDTPFTAMTDIGCKCPAPSRS